MGSPSYPGQRQQAGARRVLVCALRWDRTRKPGWAVLAGRPPHFLQVRPQPGTVRLGRIWGVSLLLGP